MENHSGFVRRKDPTDFSLSNCLLRRLLLRRLLCSCAPYSVIHEQVLDNEVGDDRLHGRGELIWGQHGDVTQRHQRSDQLLWHVSVQTAGQRLEWGGVEWWGEGV